MRAGVVWCFLTPSALAYNFGLLLFLYLPHTLPLPSAPRLNIYILNKIVHLSGTDLKRLRANSNKIMLFIEIYAFAKKK